MDFVPTSHINLTLSVHHICPVLFCHLRGGSPFLATVLWMKEERAKNSLIHFFYRREWVRWENNFSKLLGNLCSILYSRSLSERWLVLVAWSQGKGNTLPYLLSLLYHINIISYFYTPKPLWLWEERPKAVSAFCSSSHWLLFPKRWRSRRGSQAEFAFLLAEEC